jgi:preprotein translocase subunit SecF
MQFTSKFKYFAIIPAVILIAGIIVTVVSGANLGIDFTGGTTFTIDMGEDFDTDDVVQAVKDNGISDAVVLKSGETADSKTQAVIRMRNFADDEQENAARQGIVEQLSGQYANVQVGSVDRVGAIASKDLIRNAILSVTIASALILIYIWVRFELLSGVAAVVALLHDVLIMICLTIILRIQINSSFIAAVLTIVGYSINNTIVIFDRIRENTKRYGNRSMSNRDEIVNRSIKESITRALFTSLTTLITIGCVYILGVDSIKEFALPIIIGLVAGTYSSVLLVGPFWALLHKGQKKSRQA